MRGRPRCGCALVAMMDGSAWSGASIGEVSQGFEDASYGDV